MDWKDTVKKPMPHSETVVCPHCGEEFGQESLVEAIREEQAEISFKAGIKEVMEQPHIDGKCTGDLECFCMVKYNECDDPFNRKEFPKEPMYPNEIANGEGRLIFVHKAKLQEWGIE
mgnify:CR=1 FL=1